ncbi:MAG TPA: hypothetical protein VH302_11510 [Bryobacteraceae bacterium]|nr:hypothetical protein [Bryobacteraceae bacterium]
MPKVALSGPAARTLQADARDEMQAGRDSRAGQAARSIRRSWNYGEGKKTAAQVTVGAGIGAGVAAIGVATHGAGIPVIAALAVGGFALGKMSDTAFAKLWGRQYTGGESTREWVSGYAKADTAEQSKLLDERAHKTIRRAFQHYVTACEKVQGLRKAHLPKNCDDAFHLVTEMLQVKRHLDKARLYIHPAIFLSIHVLEYYEKVWKTWSKADEAIAKDSWHDDKKCASGRCYFDKPGARSSSPSLLGTFDVSKATSELEEAKKDIGTDPVLEFARAAKSSSTSALYMDAIAKYTDRGFAVKLKHSVTNPWERKTKGEQVAFVVKHGASMALAAGGGGAHAGADESLNTLVLLIDMGFTSADLGMDQVSEKAGESQPLGSQKDGSRTAAESQETLRDSAVHLWEIGNEWERIRDNNDNKDKFQGKTCDEALEYLRQVYKIHHHLAKTGGYLHETIEKVTKLTSKIESNISLLTKMNNSLIGDIDRLMATDHTNRCKKGSCYQRK